jgi:diguanylate cyclase (GGDEF)-like protein
MSLPKLLLRLFKPLTFVLIAVLIYLSYQHYLRSQSLAKSQSQDNVKVATALIWSQIEATFAKVDLLQQQVDTANFAPLANQILANSYLYKSVAVYDRRADQYANFNDDRLTANSKRNIEWHTFDGFTRQYAVSTLYRKSDGIWVFAIKQVQYHSPIEVWFEVDVQHTTQYLSNLKTLNNGYVFVIDSMTGKLVFHPNPNRIGTSSISYQGGLKEQIDAGRTRGSYDYFYNGELKKSVFDARNPIGWVVVSGTSQTDILFTSYQISLTAIVVFALLFLVVSFNYITFQLNQGLSQLTLATNMAAFKQDLKHIFDRFTYHGGVQFCLYDEKANQFNTIDYHGNAKASYQLDKLPAYFKSRGINYLYSNEYDPLAKQLQISGRHYVLPLYHHDSLIGVIYVNSVFYAFEGLMRAIRDFSEVALANLLLSKQVAMNDPLTGLENEHHLRQELTKANDSESLFYAVIDVCGLTAINDRYGSNIGDKVIKHVANVVKRSFPKPQSRCLARTNNGHFGLLFSANDSIDAQKQLEWLRQLVEKSPLTIDQDDIGQADIVSTVSIGATPIEGSADGTLSLGLKNLQQAKLQGRNCVYLSPSELRA